MARRLLDGDHVLPLERRPEARTLDVEELLRQVLDGRIRAPRPDRSFRWTVEDAKDLLDSIYHGYPIGALLLWQQPGRAETLRYGTVEVGAPEMTGALWVLDGHQRVHALVRVLLGRGLGSEPLALHFDLEEERFVHLAGPAELRAHHVPMTEVIDPERLMRWLQRADPAVDRARTIRLGKRVRDYHVPVYILRMEEDTVKVVYRRLNATGRPAEADDIFAAIHDAGSGGQPADLRGVVEALHSLEFGALDGHLPALEMAGRVLHGSDALEGPAPAPGISEDPAELAALERAARAAIELLQRDVGVPNESLLPYDLPLVVLTALFRHFPQIHPRSRELLARWVWRGALSGEHHDDPAHTRRALEAIVPGDEHGTVQRLLASVAHAPGEPLALESFTPDSPRGRLQLLALLGPGPRHLSTGAPLGAAARSAELTRALLPDAAAPWREHLANRIVHPPLERAFDEAILQVHDDELLASHLITPDALNRLREGDRAGFLAARAASLRAHIDAFMARKARWDVSDRPPLAALVVEDDD